MKANARFSSMHKGALDMSLVPPSYACDEVLEVYIVLMLSLVTSYVQGDGWKSAKVGRLSLAVSRR
ncbi:MAG: hypothetical protein ACI8WM_000921 [Burkholderiaceae bacterium]|jgi:hypothetical protein